MSGLRARPFGTQAWGGSLVSFGGELVDWLEVSPLVEVPLVGTPVLDPKLDAPPLALVDSWEVASEDPDAPVVIDDDEAPDVVEVVDATLVVTGAVAPLLTSAELVVPVGFVDVSTSLDEAVGPILRGPSPQPWMPVATSTVANRRPKSPTQPEFRSHRGERGETLAVTAQWTRLAFPFPKTHIHVRICPPIWKRFDARSAVQCQGFRDDAG